MISDSTSQQDYQLSIRIPYQALDDLGARQKALEILPTVPAGAVIKLQKLVPGKQPVGLALETPPAGAPIEVPA